MVVASRMNGHVEALRVVEPRLEVRMLDEYDGSVPIPEDRVVYLRTCHEDELRTSKLLEAVRFANAATGNGCRVVNRPIPAMSAQRKDTVYARLGAVGVRVPSFWSGPTPQEIAALCADGQITLPIILRAVDSSHGKKTFACNTVGDLIQAAVHLGGERTMLVQMLNTRSPVGFHRWRAYAIGDALEGPYCHVSDDWMISTEGRKIDRDPPGPWRERMRTIAGTLGLDIFSVDFVETADGADIVVVDVNPTYWYSPADPKGKHFVRVSEYLHALRA